MSQYIDIKEECMWFIATSMPVNITLQCVENELGPSIHTAFNCQVVQVLLSRLFSLKLNFFPYLSV